MPDIKQTSLILVSRQPFADTKLFNVLTTQLSFGKRAYSPPMLTVLNTGPIGTGGTSSLAEANFGVFGTAS